MGNNSSRENDYLDTEDSDDDINDDVQAKEDHSSNAESIEWRVFEGRYAIYHIQQKVSLAKDQPRDQDHAEESIGSNGPNNSVPPSDTGSSLIVKKPASVSSSKTVRSEMSQKSGMLRDLKDLY